MSGQTSDPSSEPSRFPAPLCTLSRLGLGAWAFGRTGWGDQDDRDSRAAIRRAVELGINWIDTAAVYGNGHSERLVGATLAELPPGDRPLVFTKGGVRVDPHEETTFRDLSPASLRSECEASLRRLRVERIDLYQLHWPTDDARTVATAWSTLGELQAEGKVRWAGVSNFDLDLLGRCAAIRPLDAVQLPLSLISRAAGSSVLPWLAERHDTRGLVYSPLESGLLSGGFSMRRLQTLPEGDWRRSREQFRHPRIGPTLELLGRLQPIAAGLGASVAQLAIAWTLAWPGVTATIVGARSADQVDGLASAAELNLDAAALSEVALALVETGAGEGPTHPAAGTRDSE